MTHNILLDIYRHSLFFFRCKLLKDDKSYPILSLHAFPCSYADFWLLQMKEIGELGLHIWKTQMIEPLTKELVGQLLEGIKYDRSKPNVNFFQLRTKMSFENSDLVFRLKIKKVGGGCGMMSIEKCVYLSFPFVYSEYNKKMSP